VAEKIDISVDSRGEKIGKFRERQGGGRRWGRLKEQKFTQVRMLFRVGKSG